MNEQSKSARRRYYDGAFHSRYFVGTGLDIGAGSDSVLTFKKEFRGIEDVHAWDKPQGDAQYLSTLPDRCFDFVHSSHCLEHMVDPTTALQNWIRVLKSGGYLIVTIPDEDMYEQGIWPSIFNQEHKHTFTIFKTDSWSKVSINVVDLVRSFPNVVVEKIQLLSDFYVQGRVTDQTLRPNTECAIEFIWRKK